VLEDRGRKIMMPGLDAPGGQKDHRVGLADGTLQADMPRQPELAGLAGARLDGMPGDDW
jgi:hypothetical protein